MTRMYRAAILLIVILLSSCDTSSPVSMSGDITLLSKGVFIVNEGGFQKSEASLSFYLPDSHKVYNNVFSKKNHRPLGDIGNDIAVYGNRIFIVVNNSNKIEVATADSLTSLGTLSLPDRNPYNIAIISDSKAYVTDYLTGSVTVFNPMTLQILTEISVGKNPKGIVVYNHKIYVCNSGDYSADSTVSVIDPYTDVVIKTITVGVSPNEIEYNDDGKLFVRCYGYSDWSDPSNDTPGQITVIDGTTDVVISGIDLPLSTFGHPGKMTISNNGYGYIIARDGIARFDTKTYAVTDNSFLSRQAYSIAVDPYSQLLYIGDAKDYQQPGKLVVYDKNALVQDSVTVGIIPGTIRFIY